MNRRPGLSAAVAGLSRVIVMPQVSKIVLPVFEPSRMVFDQKVIVFAKDDYGLFSILTSTIHRQWARKYSGTLASTTSYAPSDCFVTYPFPDGKINEQFAIEIDKQRTLVMRSENFGLTKLYNRMHQPSDHDPRIVDLRSLHAQLDREICDAYGWSNLDLDYGFHETDEGVRWTIGEAAREEILNRLLELNHQRHQEEVEKSLFAADGSKTSGKQRPSKSPAGNRAQLSMRDEHER